VVAVEFCSAGVEVLLEYKILLRTDFKCSSLFSVVFSTGVCSVELSSTTGVSVAVSSTCAGASATTSSFNVSATIF
jgi:hypothetical protein